MKIDRKELITTLERCRPAVDSTGSIAELKHLWLNKQHACAYNGAMGIITPFAGDFDLGLPGAELLGLLNSFDVEQVTLEAKDGNSLKLSAGKSNLTLATFDPDRRVWPFPDAVKLAKECVVTFTLTEQLLDGLKRVNLIKRSKPTRVEHHGITLNLTDEGVLLFTTDSAALARVDVKTKKQRGRIEPYKAVLPFAFAQQIVEQCEVGASFYGMKDCLAVVGKDVSIYSNLLDMSSALDLPKFTQDLSTAAKEWVEVPAGLDKLMERAAILAGQEEPYVSLVLDGKALHCEARYPYGELKEQLPLKVAVKKEAIEIYCLAPLVSTALGQAKEFAIVPTKAILFRGDNFLFMVTAHDKK